MKINLQTAEVSTNGNRVMIDFGDGVADTWNAKNIALVKEGWKRRSYEADPYVYTVQIYGSRSLLREYELETPSDSATLAFAFTVAMGAK